MNKQLYLEAIEALRQRVEAAEEDEELPILEMLAEEAVKALARSHAAQYAAKLATSTTSPPDPSTGSGQALRPDAIEVIPADFEGDIKIAQMAKRDWAWRSAGLSDLEDEEDPDDWRDDLFSGGDWDPEEDSDLWEDDPDTAHEYIGDGEDDEPGT